MDDKWHEAITLYFDRQKYGVKTYDWGHWNKANSNYFPIGPERKDCCKKVIVVGGFIPHAKTATHIANLFDLPIRKFCATVRRIKFTKASMDGGKGLTYGEKRKFKMSFQK